MAFDPFQRAWKAYDQGGIDRLNEIEAPLYVSDIDPGLTSRVADNNPGLPSGSLRWMILPDATPISRVHLVVVGGRQESYDEATEVERHVMDVLTHATSQHIKEILHPVRGTGVHRFGMQVPTMHEHVVARLNEADGMDWTKTRQLISVEERRRMRDLVAFNNTVNQNERGLRIGDLHQRIAAALLRFV